jgi:hypothetical protein
MAPPQSNGSEQQPSNQFGIVKTGAEIDPNFSLSADEIGAPEGQETDHGGGDESSSDSRVAEQAAEVEARRHGWVDKSEWRGDPSRWRPASEFLDVRNGIKSIVEDENRFLKAKVATLEQRESERSTNDARARLEIERGALLRERAEARENQDWVKFDELDQKLLGLAVQERAAPQKPAVDPAVAQAFAAFGKDNESWLKDPDLKTDFMIELKAISEVDRNMDVGLALQHAKRRVMRANPAKFGRGPARPSMFEMSGGPSGGGNGGGRSWQDLRPEIRKQAESDIARGQYTQKDFLSNCGPEDFRRY